MGLQMSYTTEDNSNHNLTYLGKKSKREEQYRALWNELEMFATAHSEQVHIYICFTFSSAVLLVICLRHYNLEIENMQEN